MELRELLTLKDLPEEVKETIGKEISIRKQLEEDLLVSEKRYHRIITEQKRTEERLRLFMDSTSDNFFVLDSQLNIVDVNLQAKKEFNKLGIDPNKVIGMNLVDLDPNLKKSGRYDQYMEINRTGKPLIIEDLVPDPKFGNKHITMKVFKVGDGLGMITTDITQRKKMEKIVRGSEEKYRMLVDNMEEGVLLENTEGIITFCNPQLKNMLGYSEEEILGKHWRFITKSEEIDKVSEETLKRPNGISTAYETVIVSKDGNNIPVKNTATPIFSETGTFQGVLSVIIDISEQKKLQLLQERFIGTTSHELRTPVTIIKGYIDFLRKHRNQPKKRVEQIFKKLGSNINRLTRLIDNVHILSKVTQDVFKISLNPTDLDEFVRTIHEQSFILYPDRPIVLNYVSHRNKTPILIDHDSILQSINNLLNNAIKNSSRESVVEIEISRSKKDVRFTVQDYGSGITLKTSFQLFQPFTHLDTQYTTKGAGLGLYIVKNIILAHKGSIEVHSQEHFGSSFTMTIPTN
ncbi:MAG: PAS domain S-box protein [Candidatus Hodarchaeales archaeon]|jgi:PAS domain S-box-containing protein